MNALFARISPARLTAGLLLTLLATGACKKDVTLKNLDVTLGQDLILQVPDSLPTTAGIWTMELDPDGSVDVRDNRKKLQEVGVQRAGYVVIDYSGDSAITGTGSWKFYPSDNPADATVLNAIQNVNFQTLKTSGAEQELTLSEAAKGKIAQLVKDKRKVTFAFDGNVSNKPVWVRFNVRIYTKLKIGI